MIISSSFLSVFYLLWSLCVNMWMWRTVRIFSCLCASHADEETFITSLTVSKWLSHHSTCLFQSTPFQSSHTDVFSFFYCSLLMCEHKETFYSLWFLCGTKMTWVWQKVLQFYRFFSYLLLIVHFLASNTLLMQFANVGDNTDQQSNWWSQLLWHLFLKSVKLFTKY